MKHGKEYMLIVMSLLNLMLISGCKKEGVVSTAPFVISGRYQYDGYSTDSIFVVNGVIDMLLSDTIITGKRRIQAVDTIIS
jgi:hypothetical protein